MYFEQIKTEGLGCYSYIIGCPTAGVMAVVDPRRQTDIYHKISEEYEMRITHIFDTHVHADHISGAQQLHDETGTDIYIHESAPITYTAKRVKDGDEFTLGEAVIHVMHTPGHTHNSISLLVTDRARSDKPQMILTGDLLFVGDIGRPDLPGEEILDEQIHNLFDSLFVKLSTLDDYIEVYPAHGQGSLCGSGMSSKSSSTLGFERLSNTMLQHREFEEFKNAIMSNLPIRPQSFSGIIAANLDKANILHCCCTDNSLTAKEVYGHLKDCTVLDLRDDLSFSGAHIPNSIHVDASSVAMLNWVGMAIAPGTPLVLVLPHGRSFEEIQLELQRIGYDDVKGYLKGGIHAWIEEGYEVQPLKYISATALRDYLSEHKPVIIDVRNLDEIRGMKIEGSVSVSFDDILSDDIGFDRSSEIIVVCQSGYRASIAASLLQAKGFTDVAVLIGGMFAWMK